MQHKTLFIFYKIKILVKQGISAIYDTIIAPLGICIFLLTSTKWLGLALKDNKLK